MNMAVMVVMMAMMVMVMVSRVMVLVMLGSRTSFLMWVMRGRTEARRVWGPWRTRSTARRVHRLA